MDNKRFYTAPAVESLELCLGGIVCGSDPTTYGITGAPGVAISLDDPNFDFGDF